MMSRRFYLMLLGLWLAGNAWMGATSLLGASSPEAVEFQIIPEKIWPGGSFQIRWQVKLPELAGTSASLEFPGPEGLIQQHTLDLQAGSGVWEVKEYDPLRTEPVLFKLHLPNQTLERRLSFHTWSLAHFPKVPGYLYHQNYRSGFVSMQAPQGASELAFITNNNQVASFAADPAQTSLSLQIYQAHPVIQLLKLGPDVAAYYKKFVALPTFLAPNTWPEFAPLPYWLDENSKVFVFQERLYLIDSLRSSAFSISLKAPTASQAFWIREPFLEVRFLREQDFEWAVLGESLYAYSGLKRKLMRFQALTPEPGAEWLLGSLAIPEVEDFPELPETHGRLIVAEGLLLSLPDSKSPGLAYSPKERRWVKFHLLDRQNRNKRHDLGLVVWHDQHLWYLQNQQDGRTHLRTMPVSADFWFDPQAPEVKKPKLSGCPACVEQEVQLHFKTLQVKSVPAKGSDFIYQATLISSTQTPGIVHLRLLHEREESMYFQLVLKKPEGGSLDLVLQYINKQWMLFSDHFFSLKPQKIVIQASVP